MTSCLCLLEVRMSAADLQDRDRAVLGSFPVIAIGNSECGPKNDFSFLFFFFLFFFLCQSTDCVSA